MFGRPPRDTGLEAERRDRPTPIRDAAELQPHPAKIETVQKLESLFQSVNSGTSSRKGLAGAAARGGKNKRFRKAESGSSESSPENPAGTTQVAEVPRILPDHPVTVSYGRGVKKISEYMQSARTGPKAAIDVAWAVIDMRSFCIGISCVFKPSD